MLWNGRVVQIDGASSAGFGIVNEKIKCCDTLNAKKYEHVTSHTEHLTLQDSNLWKVEQTFSEQIFQYFLFCIYDSSKP